MHFGGVEKCMLNMLKAFDYQKYDVTLWLLREEGELLQDIPEKVHVKFFGEDTPKSTIINNFKKKELIKLIQNLYYMLLVRIFKNNYCISNKYMCKIMPTVSKEAYDYFIVYHGWDYRAMYNALFRFSAKKYVLWLHCEPWLPVKYFLPYINNFDKIFCVSKSIKEQAKKLLYNYSKKDSIEELYNLSDAKEIIEKSKERIENLDSFSIVTVGRLGIEKGQEMIPEIVRKLLNDGHDVKWYLIGDGSKREEIELNIRKYKVEKNVLLLGAKYNPYPYIRKCDLYVQPSYTEGYCTTTVEAKILNKPIVVTDVPGMREQFIDRKNALIVKKATVESIYTGVKEIIERPALMEQFVSSLKMTRNDNMEELNKLYRYMENES